jgi:hypothetical protein
VEISCHYRTHVCAVVLEVVRSVGPAAVETRALANTAVKWSAIWYEANPKGSLEDLLVVAIHVGGSGNRVAVVQDLNRDTA